MDKESYCKLHDTYPKDGKPCWQCINACRPGFDFYRQLQAENKELKAWQKNMQNEVDMAHDAEIELLTLREKTERKYGQHPPYCQIHKLIGHKPELGCSCGLKELEAKVKQLKKGNIIMPKFDPESIKGIKLDLTKPEDAYLWGWECAIFECGEVLSKP